MTKDEEMQLAIEALEKPHPGVRTDLSDALAYREKVKQAITALRQALEQAEMVQSIKAKLAYKEWCKSNNWISFPEWFKRNQAEKQEPVAWRFDQAKYRENDLRGRQWVFNCFSPSKPYMDEMVQNVTPLYTRPQPAAWVGLTDEEIDACMDMSIQKTCRAIEAKLKEKNT